MQDNVRDKLFADANWNRIKGYRDDIVLNTLRRAVIFLSLSFLGSSVGAQCCEHAIPEDTLLTHIVFDEDSILSAFNFYVEEFAQWMNSNAALSFDKVPFTVYAHGPSALAHSYHLIGYQAYVVSGILNITDSTFSHTWVYIKQGDRWAIHDPIRALVNRSKTDSLLYFSCYNLDAHVSFDQYHALHPIWSKDAFRDPEHNQKIQEFYTLENNTQLLVEYEHFKQLPKNEHIDRLLHNLDGILRQEFRKALVDVFQPARTDYFEFCSNFKLGFNEPPMSDQQIIDELKRIESLMFSIPSAISNSQRFPLHANDDYPDEVLSEMLSYSEELLKCKALINDYINAPSRKRINICKEAEVLGAY